MQILPARDRGGRTVYCDMNMFNDRAFKRPLNRLKAFVIYILLSLAEDEENQKRGVLGVIMQLGRVNPSDVDPEASKEKPWFALLFE
jgi:hypothetical protein